jgi:hypothetical protein
MKKITILLILWVMFLPIYLKQTVIPYTDRQICNSIYIIEGKEKANQAYGINPDYNKCSTREACETLCLNTVRKNKVRFKNQVIEKDYLVFLAKRYCPLNWESWLKNLKFYLKEPTQALVSESRIYPSYIKTPQDIEDWLIKEGFQYIPDKTKEDEWKPPEKTVKDRGGDCEDYAILTDYILEDLGYKNSMIIAIYGPGLAHGICWFQDKDGTWSFFSTGTDGNGNNRFYHNCKVDNPFKILYFYFPEWTHMKLCVRLGLSVNTVYRKDIGI